MHEQQDLSELIPVYNIFNMKLGDITIREALKHVAEDEMFIRSKGKGNNRRIHHANGKSLDRISR